MPEIKRVCFFCSLSSFNTGMPVSTFKLIEHYSNRPEYKVFVILPSEGELALQVRKCGIEPQIIPFHRMRSPARFFSFVKFLISFPVAFTKTARFFSKNRIWLVHFSDIIDMPFYVCPKLAGAKSIAHLRHCIENSFGRIAFNILTFMFTSKVICISDAVRKYSGLSKKRSCVIYNPGPNPELFDPHKKHLPISGFDSSKKLVLAIGTLLPVKGHENFIRMAHIIEIMHPGLCRFVIVGNKAGGREEYFDKLRKLTKDLSLDSVIMFIEKTRHENIPAILSRSSVFVHLPDYQEGLGGVILEAMAMEIPVVAFDSGGAGECFTNGVSGFLVGQYDIKAAAQSVLKLIEDEQLCSLMGKNGRKELTERFSYKKHFMEIDNVYNSI
jgi:glycosyltransferase involved in cell wall biosynthesis